MSPDTIPAPKTVPGVGVMGRPVTLSPVASSRATTNSTANPRWVSRVIATEPNTVPGIRPKMAHTVPRLSMSLRSRRTIKSETTAPMHRNDPGMSRGSTKTSTGAAIKPKPKPNDPWMTPPVNRASAAMAIPANPTSRTSTELYAPLPISNFPEPTGLDYPSVDSDAVSGSDRSVSRPRTPQAGRVDP